MIRSSIVYSVLGIAGVILLFFFVAYRSTQAPFIVEWQEERLSVIAEKAPLSDILQEVELQTGLKVNSSKALEEVSIQFHDLPLDEGIRRLLASAHDVIPENISANDKSSPFSTPSIIGSEVMPATEHDTHDEANVANRLLQDAVLYAPDTNTRLASIQKLIKNGERQIIDVLYAATKDTDPSIRQLAHHQLFKLNAEQAADVLTRDSTSDDTDIRMTAIESAARLLGADAAEILKNATEDDNPNIKQMAFQQLVQLNGDAGLEIVRERLSHADPEIRIMAIEAMASKGEEYADEAARSALNDIDELVRSKAQGLIQELEASKR